MRFYTSRKPALLNFSLLLMFLAGWLLSYLMPALKGLMQEEHLFYGTVSHAAIPSIFGGSNIPFFDKTIFQINGDDLLSVKAGFFELRGKKNATVKVAFLF